MKSLRYRQGTFLLSTLAITLLFTITLFISSTNALNPTENLGVKDSKQAIPDLKKGMYLVLGAFRIPENAIKYAKSIKINSKSPSVGRNKDNGLYYVFAYATKDNLEYAREKRTELRSTNQFYDAWILYVGLNLEDLQEKEVTPDVVAIDQPKETNIEVKKEQETGDLIPPPTLSPDQNLYNYRFNVISATTLKEIPGYVTIIDAARNKAMKSVSTNQIHQLAAPSTQSKEIIALSDIFGYVKEQMKLKIDDPMSSSDKSMISESGQITTVKFELSRHKVGDIITMYHVYFYSNSAIMKPDSKFELNSLLGMLKENEKLEIKIHGHTNGNASGKIISLKEGDQNFFAITPNNDEGTGSAKALSRARGEIIMRWLIEQGIDKKRMDLKGWGGKKMLYGKTDAMAGRNVRVEIELLKG